MPEIDKVGQLNIRYGICGFASSLYAVYDDSPQKLKGELANEASKRQRLMAEIYGFLNACGKFRLELLTEITEFTQSFGGRYATFTIAAYKESIKKKLAGKAKTPDFSIALTPNAVVYYLQMFGGYANAKVLSPTAAPARCVVGVANSGVGGPHDGLKHWVYYRGGTIFSWGEQFAGGDLDAALGKLNTTKGETYEVCCKIGL